MRTEGDSNAFSRAFLIGLRLPQTGDQSIGIELNLVDFKTRQFGATKGPGKATSKQARSRTPRRLPGRCARRIKVETWLATSAKWVAGSLSAKPPVVPGGTSGGRISSVVAETIKSPYLKKRENRV